MFNLFTMFFRHNDKSDHIVAKMRKEVRKEVKRVVKQQKILNKAVRSGDITTDMLKALGAKI